MENELKRYDLWMEQYRQSSSGDQRWKWVYFIVISLIECSQGFGVKETRDFYGWMLKDIDEFGSWIENGDKNGEK